MIKIELGEIVFVAGVMFGIFVMTKPVEEGIAYLDMPYFAAVAAACITLYGINNLFCAITSK